VGLIADSGLICRSVKRLLTMRINYYLTLKLRPPGKLQNLTLNVGCVSQGSR
jgi:hypothetical protein